MVYVHYALDSSLPDDVALEKICAGLSSADIAKIQRALDFVQPLYAAKRLGTGEEISRHVFGMALIATSLRLDVNARLAALLFAAHEFHPHVHGDEQRES